MTPLNDSKASRLGWAAGAPATGRPPSSAGSRSSSSSVFVTHALGTSLHRRERRQRRRVPHGRPHHRRGRLLVDENGESVEEQAEIVLIQSKTLTVDDAAFRAVDRGRRADARTLPEVTEAAARRSPPGTPTSISHDGHSAMVQFTPEGHLRGGRPLHRRASSPRSTRSQAGIPASTSSRLGISTERRSTRRSRAAWPRPACISIPLTIIILLFVLRSLVAALIPLLLGAHVRRRDDRA